jgi:SET domain-containing protein
MKIPKQTADAADLDAVEVRQSDVHGKGVFALRDLRAGHVIGHYTGRYYAPDETHPGWNDQLTYLFGLSDGYVIDGAEGGNATRHINHACIPNVEAVERRGADDELSIVVRTVRALRAGDELFLDYALVIDGDDPADYPCACGTDACRGTMAAPAAMTALAA